MRAIITESTGDLDDIRIDDRPEPRDPGAGQAILRVRAASLNYRDILVGTGVGKWRPLSGRVLGSDAAGDVVAIGADVDPALLDARVITSILPDWIEGPANAAKLSKALGGPRHDGVFAEYVMVDAASLVPAPKHMTDEEAATLVCAGLTAWHALTKAGSLRPGRTVLTEGTGGVSVYALQLASAAGATVFSTSSSDTKLKQVVDLGAAQVINYREHPAWADEVMALTGRVGVDHVIDIGGASTLQQSIAATAYEGTVSIVGLLGGLEATLDVSTVFNRNLRLQGIETGSRQMLAELARWCEEVAFRPVIAATYPLAEARRAFEGLAKQDQVGKICLAFP